MFVTLRRLTMKTLIIAFVSSLALTTFAAQTSSADDPQEIVLFKWYLRASCGGRTVSICGCSNKSLDEAVSTAINSAKSILDCDPITIISENDTGENFGPLQCVFPDDSAVEMLHMNASGFYERLLTPKKWKVIVTCKLCNCEEILGFGYGSSYCDAYRMAKASVDWDACNINHSRLRSCSVRIKERPVTCVPCPR